MPWRTAPDWPVSPPPCTRTRRSYWPSTPATLSGDMAIVRQMLRGKYSSSVRPLTHVAPSPGRRITRATDVLRLPVPRYCAIWLKSLLQIQGLGVLRAMRMHRARVDLQLVDLLSRQPVLGEHPLHGDAQHLGRTPVELLAKRAALQAAGIARVPVVPLLVELVARDRDLLGVHDDDEVARVDVRRVHGLALATQGVCDQRRKPAERLPVGIDEIPLARDFSRLGVVRLHT